MQQGDAEKQPAPAAIFGEKPSPSRPARRATVRLSSRNPGTGTLD
jgi:hypothetical protein